MKYLIYEKDGKLIIKTNSSCMSIIQSRNNIEFMIRKNVPKGSPYLWLDEKELPNRRYQTAWKFDESKTSVVIDEKKAVKIARQYALYALEQFAFMKFRDAAGIPIAMSPKENEEYEEKKRKIQNCDSRGLLGKIETGFRGLT